MQDHPCDPLDRRLFGLLAVTVMLALLLRLASAGPFMTLQGILALFIFNPFVSGLCLGIFLHYLFLSRSWKERLSIAFFATLLELPLAYHRWLYAPELILQCFGVGLGLATLAFGLIPRFLQNVDLQARTRHRRAFFAPVLMLCSFFVGHFTVGLVAQASPLVNDLYGYAIDLQFGPSLSFVIAGIMRQTAWLQHLLLGVYNSLAIPMVLTQVRYMHSPRQIFLNPTLAFVLMGTLGGLLYFAFPMVGAEKFFARSFPFYPPPRIDPQSILFGNLDAPRRCLPSLHGAWALSVCWLNWKAGGWIRSLTLLFLLLTLPAALSTGHYLMDFVYSFPLVVLIHALIVWFCGFFRGDYASSQIRQSARSSMAQASLMLFGSVGLLVFWPGAFLVSSALCYGWALGIVAWSWRLEMRLQALCYPRLQAHSGSLRSSA